MAASFAPSLKWLAAEYEKDSGQVVRVISGSTGKLYAQIRQGAPYDLFFSADIAHPRKLEEANLTDAGSRETYAIGQLAAWQTGENNSIDINALVSSSGRLSIANPRLAPYGLAARQWLQSQQAWEAVQSRLLRAENVSQAFHYVSSGQAEWGLLPLALLMQSGVDMQSVQLLGAGYEPIEQQAVVLKGENADRAKKFLAYCLSPKAQTYLQANGFKVPQ